MFQHVANDEGVKLLRNDVLTKRVEQHFVLSIEDTCPKDNLNSMMLVQVVDKWIISQFYSLAWTPSGVGASG